MLKKYQYKHFTKIKNFAFIPFRPLKFKRSKWFQFKLLWNARLKSERSYVKRSKNLTEFDSSKILLKKRIPLDSRFLKLKGSFRPLFKNLLAQSSRKSILVFSRRKRKNIMLKAYISNIRYKRFKHFNSNKSFSFRLRKKNIPIFNKFKLFAMKGRFIHLSNLSKDKTQSKLKLKYLLNQQAPVFRRDYKDRELFISRLYQDNFCLNGASASYYFSKTFREIKDKLKSNVVVLNDQKLRRQVFLEKGDVLSFNTNISIPVRKNIKSYSSLNSLPSHLEADLYSQTLVSIKDMTMVSQSDYHLMCLEYVNAQNI